MSDTPETRSPNAAIIFLVISAFIGSMGFGLAAPVMPELVMQITEASVAEAAAMVRRSVEPPLWSNTRTPSSSFESAGASSTKML